MDSELERLTAARRRTIGTKQTLKALRKGEALEVFIARDAEERIQSQVLEGCRGQDVKVNYVDTMAQLGKTCGIEVGAAVAAILE